MKVHLAIERSLAVPQSAEQVRQLFADLETTIGRFPKLKKLTPLAPNRWRWDMDVIGSRIARIAHSVSYAADYTTEPNGNLRFTPVAGIGNASVEGRFAVTPQGEGALLSFSVKGELREVPVPLMYRLIAPAFIQGKFTAMVDAFLQRTKDALADGAVAKKPARKKAA